MKNYIIKLRGATLKNVLRAFLLGWFDLITTEFGTLNKKIFLSFVKQVPLVDFGYLDNAYVNFQKLGSGKCTSYVKSNLSLPIKLISQELNYSLPLS